MAEHIFTSESVTDGHPDKVCDRIADAILDEVLATEATLEAAGYIAPDGSPARLDEARVAIECLVTTGTVIVAGEVRCQGYIDIQEVVRRTLKEIGYDREGLGFAADEVAVINLVHEQSADIAQGVDGTAYRDDEEDLVAKTGAGDQGIMFGYACDETPSLMPLPIALANELALKLREYRCKTVKEGGQVVLRPDGKTQVSVRYDELGRPIAIDTVLVSTSHDPIEIADGADDDYEHACIEKAVTENVIVPVLEKCGYDWKDVKILVNPTGRFVISGPMGDSGVCGRKLVVDTYGGMGHIGGGAMSGKDCTKVDRSAAYAARWAAKNVVAAGLASRCEIQLSYAIGISEPISVLVDTFGTGKYSDDKLAEAVSKAFDFRPGAIIRDLRLREPVFSQTAAFGHFGREGFAWEDTSKAPELIAAIEEI